MFSADLVLFRPSRNATEVDINVLEGGESEEMDAWPVNGKSFISVDPLGQVDWSWAFWFGFYTLPSPPAPPPTESTLLLQLLQTEKVMGLRFCPDKGVRTLSLLLTPLSHQWDQGSRKRGRRGVVNHSLPPSSCLKPSASELSLAPLYLIMGCSRVDRFSQFYYSVSCQLKRDFRGVHILWLCFRIACPVPR